MRMRPALPERYSRGPSVGVLAASGLLAAILRAATALSAAALPQAATEAHAAPVPQAAATPQAPAASSPATTTVPPGPAAGAVVREVLATDSARVRNLVLEPGTSTGLHTHANAHIAAALSPGDLADTAADGAERRRTMAEGALAFVPAGVSHALRNVGESTFRAVTIDLLGPQTGARNRCGELLPGQPTDCPAIPPKKGQTLVPQMETDQAIVSLLTLDPGAGRAFKPSAKPPLVVALAGTEARALIELKIPGGAVGKGEKPLEGGDAATTVPEAPLTIRNTGKGPARFVVVEFKK